MSELEVAAALPGQERLPGVPSTAPSPELVSTGERLKQRERERLVALEKTIAYGKKTFLLMVEALSEIHEGRLYRESYRTFEDYCEGQWGFVASRARQLIGSAKVARNIAGVTNVTPGNESQLRTLAGLEPDEQREAWRLAVESAPNGRVTGKHVRDVVAHRFKHPALLTSQSNEWYTPSKYVELVREVMGGIVTVQSIFLGAAVNWESWMHERYGPKIGRRNFTSA